MATQLRVTAKAGDGGERASEGERRGREETRDNCVEVSKCNIINTHTSEATKMMPQKPVDTLSTRQAVGKVETERERGREEQRETETEKDT